MWLLMKNFVGFCLCLYYFENGVWMLMIKGVFISLGDFFVLVLDVCLVFD